MLRRENYYNNTMTENFFYILKTECIYRHKQASFCEAKKIIDHYIYFYNHECMQLKTGVAALTLRHSAPLKTVCFPTLMLFCCTYNFRQLGNDSYLMLLLESG